MYWDLETVERFAEDEDEAPPDQAILLMVGFGGHFERYSSISAFLFLVSFACCGAPPPFFISRVLFFFCLFCLFLCFLCWHVRERTFLYDEPIFMVSEVDGLRIFSNSRCEFLEKVPESSEKIFEIGSVGAPALLVDAFQEYTV